MDEKISELEDELLRSVDSLYAEHGSNVTRADVEESIKGICAMYKIDNEDG